MKVTQWNYRQLSNEQLEAALLTIKDRRLIAAIQAELDSRRQLGVNRPLTIEDYL